MFVAGLRDLAEGLAQTCWVVQDKTVLIHMHGNQNPYSLFTPYVERNITGFLKKEEKTEAVKRGIRIVQPNDPDNPQNEFEINWCKLAEIITEINPETIILTACNKKGVPPSWVNNLVRPPEALKRLKTVVATPQGFVTATDANLHPQKYNQSFQADRTVPGFTWHRKFNFGDYLRKDR